MSEKEGYDVIKGIDAQIMIQRTVDYARQSSEQTSQVQQSQEFLKHLQQERAVQQTQAVNQTAEAEQNRIERDNKRREQREQEEKRKEKPDSKAAREIVDDVRNLSVGFVEEGGLDIEV